MPKKFGENSKAAAAREKKEAVVSEKKQKESAEKERKLAEEWSVGAKKNPKKELEEAKKAEKLAKKAEKDALESQENKELDQIKKVKAPRGAEKIATKREQKVETHTQERTIEAYEARNIDDALTLLSLTSSSSSAPSSSKLAAEDFLIKNPNTEDPSPSSSSSGSLVSISSSDALERHPERRMKAAYAKYEERELPILKDENPGLRFTQLKEILWKNWQKSPENPLNQQHIDYNIKPSEEKKMIVEEKQAKLESMRIN